MRPRSPRNGKENPRVLASLPFVEQLARRVEDLQAQRRGDVQVAVAVSRNPLWIT